MITGKQGVTVASVRYFTLWLGEEMGCFESSDAGMNTSLEWARRNGRGATVEAEAYMILTEGAGLEKQLGRRLVFAA